MEDVQSTSADEETSIEAGLRNAREAVDRADLEAKVKGVYRQVAFAPKGKLLVGEVGSAVGDPLGVVVNHHTPDW